MNNARPKIAIIGAGWAGLAAAVELAGQAALTLFEAGREPGGRARRLNSGASLLDNGQHILIGAYRECLQLMRKVGVDEATAMLRLPLVWQRQGGMRMQCPRWPAPLHVLAGLLTASGIGWWDKWQLARALQGLRWQGWRLPQDMTVAQWLAAQGQSAHLVEQFWRPMVLSALNTPLELASMQILATTLRDSLGASRAASDLLLPRSDLTALFPGPALHWLREQGLQWRAGVRVAQISPAAQGVMVDGELFDAAILAVAPYHAAELLQEPQLHSQIKAFHYWPIYTAYLRYDADITMPVPMTGLQGGTLDWLFDRQALSGERGLLAAVISAPPPAVRSLDRASLLDKVQADVELLLPALNGLVPLERQLIVEKRATFASSVGLTRPHCRSRVQSVYLAGDWLCPDYPATLEGAVRSGLSAARQLMQDLPSSRVADR
ncbi:hydroxysqualene dehydroxylase HpnE [Aquitalea sp. LB_tupeE]|uniref:hydroxysqualene dehydroxylase HpnE n=1 Tax=Aquitalea sp. LB_tupeE TaxID=2748078 RepID=UPI00351A9835